MIEHARTLANSQCADHVSCQHTKSNVVTFRFCCGHFIIVIFCCSRTARARQGKRKTKERSRKEKKKYPKNLVFHISPDQEFLVHPSVFPSVKGLLCSSSRCVAYVNLLCLQTGQTRDIGPTERGSGVFAVNRVHTAPMLAVIVCQSLFIPPPPPPPYPPFAIVRFDMIYCRPKPPSLCVSLSHPCFFVSLSVCLSNLCRLLSLSFYIFPYPPFAIVRFEDSLQTQPPSLCVCLCLTSVSLSVCLSVSLISVAF